MDRKHRTLISRPAWLCSVERAIGQRIAIHPNVLSTAKLLVATPLLLWSLHAQVAPVVVLAFFAFAALDYLDGVVARERKLATAFGRVFDRVTDYPLLIGASLFCKEVVPMELVAIKIAVDLFLLLLFALGRGSTQNRLRTALSYTTLLALLMFSQSWTGGLITGSAIRFLLLMNIGLSAVVALYNLDVLRKKQVANLLSLGNLVCGVLAIWFASRGTPVVSLMLMIVGVTFDGFDGVAARRWGSTSWGVCSDDIADAVNFALAPAAVLYFALGGAAGATLASLYAVCTIGRLVYFTLNKKNADPRYFNGAPSPVGGLIAICGAILFSESPALVGLLVGVACSQMVSFSTAYRHLGRFLAGHPRALLGVPLALALLAATHHLFGLAGPLATLLVVALAYAAWPTVRAFIMLRRAHA
jgi:CDP-diacylglycerol--serine O-phosphatidyltransferase